MATTSSRPVWTGSISFGLISVPVKLFIAVREKTIHFRTLHDQDLMPLRQKMVCSADGKEVHREHIVKGYEVEKDHFVVIRQSELEAVAPKSSKAIEIQDFVALEQIDPLYFDRPYYVVPSREGARSYKLLLEAMIKSKKVAIAKIVMHNKEYLAALRPLEEEKDGEPRLVLETMHFSDEIVSAAKADDGQAKAKVDDRELKVAQQLIEALTTEFHPERYHDDYREKVMELIDQKAEGKTVAKHAASHEPKSNGGPSLIAALEASLASSRNGNGSVKAQPAKRRKSA